MNFKTRTAFLSAAALVMCGQVMSQQRVELGALNGEEGTLIIGAQSTDMSGFSVSEIGDINGDSVTDLIIGAPHADRVADENQGKSFVVFGQSGFSAASFNLASLDGSNGFVITGIDSLDESGTRVRNAGDINNDGTPDLVIGAPMADHAAGIDAGEAYVIYGSDQPFPANINLEDLDGSNGFVLQGADAGDLLGGSVSAAGDFNNDGIDDLIVGAYQADNGAGDEGEAVVLFGSGSGFPAAVSVTDLDGSNGLVFRGIDAGDLAGRSVSAAGDPNADGIDDIIIGASLASAPGQFSGEAYVVFGSSQPFSASFELSTLDGLNGFVISGAPANEELGESVSGLGDINDDGFDDLLIGAPGAAVAAEPQVGRAYLVFGTNGGFPQNLDVSALNGSNGFVLNGVMAASRSGDVVSNVGDFNGDGFNDLLVGAGNASIDGRAAAGQAYLLFGSDLGFASSIDLVSLPADRGFLLNGSIPGEMAGISVSGGGDFNNDGLCDVLIGAFGGASGAGTSYLLFGNRSSAQAIPAPAGVTGSAFFGSAVDIDSNLIVVGVPGSAGGVAVYRIEGRTARLITTLPVPDGFSATGFGASVAVSGNTIVVGSQTAGVIAAKGAPATPLYVAVYQPDESGNFVFRQALAADGTSSVADRFGLDVAIERDTIVVGAPDDDEGEDAGMGSGAAYVFVRPSANDDFTPVQKLKPVMLDAGAQFGASVAVRGSRLAVGAPTAEPQSGVASGAVWAYFRSGDTYNLIDSVTGSSSGDAAGFGADVALDVDGSLLAGAAFEDGESNGLAGAAYLFSTSGGAVTELARIKPIDPVDDDAFGLSVAIDGDTLSIGAPGAPQRGAVYRFRRDGNNVQQVSRTEGFADQGSLGAAVAVAGRSIVTGAPLSDGDRGSAFLQLDDSRIFFSGFED